jgi:hypothetical protein
MATKAERFLATELVERSIRNAGAHPKRRSPRKPEKAHNLGDRAGRAARVSYEASNGRPSRKSTRGSEHHQRATNRLERTNQLKLSAPGARARRARAQTLKIKAKVTKP